MFTEKHTYKTKKKQLLQQQQQKTLSPNLDPCSTICRIRLQEFLVQLTTTIKFSKLLKAKRIKDLQTVPFSPTFEQDYAHPFQVFIQIMKSRITLTNACLEILLTDFKLCIQQPHFSESELKKKTDIHCIISLKRN